ncbi:MAG: site-specific integrase [Saprospiraceae bacterium]
MDSRLKYSIGEFVEPKYWNLKRERAKVTAAHPEYADLNNRLDDILGKVSEIKNKNPNIDIKSFKTKLDIELGREVDRPENGPPTFFEFIVSYINIEKGRVNSTLTWKKYHTIYNHLVQYCLDKNLNELNYEDIDISFLASFTDWCYSEPRNQSQNTVSKAFEVIKKFLKLSSKMYFEDEEGKKHPYHNNQIFLDDEFNVGRVDTSKHPLHFDEIMQLYNYDLSQNQRLDRIRDLFLVSCLSGLRFSDFSRLQPQHIFEDDGQLYIRMFTKKGDSQKKDNEVVIHCIPELKAILTKYNFNIPAGISNQKMNAYLKELGKLVGLNRQILDKSSVGGSIVETNKPIWETIVNHTGRYSFVNIMINEFGIRAEDLCKITGQSLKILLHYERGNKLENARKVGGFISEQRIKLK